MPKSMGSRFITSRRPPRRIRITPIIDPQLILHCKPVGMSFWMRMRGRGRVFLPILKCQKIAKFMMNLAVSYYLDFPDPYPNERDYLKYNPSSASILCHFE